MAKAVAAKPDVILSTLIGDSNQPFYERIRKGNKTAAGIPIVSFIITEDELRALSLRADERLQRLQLSSPSTAPRTSSSCGPTGKRTARIW